MTDIALYVNGLIWKGWQEATVTHSIDAVFGSFDLRLTRGWPDGEPDSVPPVREGDDCRLTLDGETVITGFVNQVSLRTDSDGYDLKVSGRDRTALLFKGCVLNEPAEWKGVDALAIAREIAKPFGISVSAEVGVGASFGKFTVQPGTTANRALERLCRHRALFHHATRDGNLVLTSSAAAKGLDDVLKHGPKGNVLEATYSSDLSERHSEYIVKNQTQGSSWGGNEHAKVTARAVDKGVKQYCPRVIVPDEPGDAAAMKKLAVAQAALNAGRSRTVGFTVPGWARASGGLWPINRTVPVRDVVSGLDEAMLIKRAVFTVSPTEAPATALTLVDPRAYTRTAEPEETQKGGWG